MIENLEQGRSRYITNDFSGGYNLVVDPTKIKDNEFTVFENLIASKFGSFTNATKRKGLQVYNTNALNTAYTSLLSIYEYINKKAGFTRLIGKTNSAIEYATGTGTWTVIDSDDDSATLKERFLTFRDKLYIFDRRADATTLLKNKYYDGTTFLDAGLIPAYHNMRTLDIQVVGLDPLANGTYYYFITFVYDNQESWGIAPNWSDVYPDEDSSKDGDFHLPKLPVQLVQGTTSGGNEVIKLYQIPTGNARVTARKIYRTKAGGGQLYYLATIDNNTDTVFYDNKADAELVEEADLDYVFRPLSAKYGVQHKNRIFTANLKENQFGTAPDTADVTMTSSTGGGIQVSGDTRVAIFNYKFAFLYLKHVLQTTATGVPDGLFSGFTSVYSGAFSKTMEDPTHNRNTISGIDNLVATNPYAGRVLIKRTTCQFITDVTQDGSETVIEVDGVSYAFQEGESVTISGVAGLTSNPNGTFTVNSVDVATKTIRITHDTVGGTYTAGTGIVRGSRYHYLGTTPIISSTNARRFIDDIPDTDMVLGGNLVNLKGIEELTEDKSLPSTIQWSEVNQGDKFPGLNSQEIAPNDNDEIRGIFSENDGLRIFKDRNIYKLYTTNIDQDFWEYRRTSTNIGSTDSYSIVQIDEQEYVFLSNNTFYHQIGDKPLRCSDKIQTDLDGLTFTNIDVCFDPVRNWVIYTYSVSGTDGNILIYDLNNRDERGLGTWYHWKKNSDSLSVRCPFKTQAGLLLFASDLKRVYKYDETSNQDAVGSSFAQVNIKIKLQTKTFQAPILTIKRFLASINASGTGTITVYHSVDNAENNFTHTIVSPTAITRINEELTLQPKEVYFRLENSDNIALSIRKIGYDFEVKHNSRGEY